MTIVQNRRPAPVPAAGGPTPVLDGLRHELQELGLRPYAARVLVALLRLGSANSAQLAAQSGVPRTSIYQVMDAMAEQGLVETLPTLGPTVWTSEGWDAILDILDAAEEERLRRHHSRTRSLREELAEVLPPTSPPAA